MKTNHYFKTAYIAIAAILMTTGLAAQNLLTNGDFEISVAPFGWTKNNQDIVFAAEEGNSINGKSCRMPGLSASRNILQNVTISTPGNYIFKFTGRIQNAVGPNGTVDNNHATNGPATITAQVFGFDVDGTTLLTNALLTITSQANSNTTDSGVVVIPQEITRVQVKISKNWNVPYIDDVMLYLEGTLGITDNRIEEMQIYSSEDFLNVTSSSALSQINIIDITGKMQLSVSCKSEFTKQISLENISTGLYIIVATDIEGKVGTVKHMLK